jgi:hypothetical protein
LAIINGCAVGIQSDGGLEYSMRLNLGSLISWLILDSVRTAITEVNDKRNGE